jgi:hypothetical protein
MHRLTLIKTAKRFHHVAQGRPERVEGRTLGPYRVIIIYAKGVTQPTANRLFNPSD